MLKTNAQGRKLYTLVRISTNEVLKRNVLYPAATDDAPIDGLDPDLQYLAIDEDVQPEYDPRLFSLQTVEAKVGELWRVTHPTTPRGKDERKVAAFNRKMQEIYKQIDPAELPELLFLAVYALARKQKNITWTAKEQAIMDRLNVVGSAFWKNLERQAAIETAIDAGQDPDIDAGWEPKA